jgi:hypothetical protein
MDVHPETLNTFAIAIPVLMLLAYAAGAWLDRKADKEKRKQEEKR